MSQIYADKETPRSERIEHQRCVHPSAQGNALVVCVDEEPALKGCPTDSAQTAKPSRPGSTGVPPVGYGVLATTNFDSRWMRVKSSQGRDAGIRLSLIEEIKEALWA